jgi:hypothetical protein
LAHLSVNALAVCRYSCIPVNHGFIMHLINAPEKPKYFKPPILVHNS